MPGRGVVQFNRLPGVTAVVPKMVDEVVLATAGNIVDLAAASMEGQTPPSPPGHAPAIRSGILHGSLKVDESQLGSDHRAIVYTDVEYAPHLEFGTITMEARPFLRPAAERARPSFERALKVALRSMR